MDETFSTLNQHQENSLECVLGVGIIRQRAATGSPHHWAVAFYEFRKIGFRMVCQKTIEKVAVRAIIDVGRQAE
jgi:hypothetical protein